MDAPSPDESSTLILRMFVTADGVVRIRLVAIGPGSEERNLGTVTSAAAAAALVRGWIDALIDAVRPDPVSRPDPLPGR